ncbi:MAG: hypothetical protein IPG49_07880 [Proteobacteria bacterium]|nr:hypothetical protein [Pseudomonadota bacterium]
MSRLPWRRRATALLAAGVDLSVRRRELRLLNGDGWAAPDLPGVWRQAG